MIVLAADARLSKDPFICNGAIESRDVSLHLKSMDTQKFATARYRIGQAVRHRLFPFRGVIFDVDPEFANTEEWYQAIPEEIRPAREQPFYHLFAENAETEYIAYVSEQNLLPDDSGQPFRNPQVLEFFTEVAPGEYAPRDVIAN